MCGEAGAGLKRAMEKEAKLLKDREKSGRALGLTEFIRAKQRKAE